MSLSENDLSSGCIPRRYYRDDVYLSAVGFSGIVLMNTGQEATNQVGEEAVETGVNYFDVAPSYGDAQATLRSALEAFRKDVFLACTRRKPSA